MNNPKRNDIFEDQNGLRVAVKQMYPPNAVGISYVEYKNLSDSNLRFMPLEKFLELFQWVDNFGTIDTFVKVVVEKEAKLGPEPEGAEAATPDATPDSENKTAETADGAEAADVTHTEIRRSS